jgi:hypothetical protein
LFGENEVCPALDVTEVLRDCYVRIGDRRPGTWDRGRIAGWQAGKRFAVSK